jgi:hypothetical protein
VFVVSQGEEVKLKLTAGEVEQLALIDDALDDGVERSITQDEARMISESARKTFEGVARPAWFDDYLSLREAGWSWRVAAYIAWAASPVTQRNPKNQSELATDVLGLRSDRTIRKWKENNPAIEEAIAVAQASPLLKHRREIYTALTVSAMNSEAKHHSDRKLASVLLGDYVEKKDVHLSGKAKDLSELSDGELAELAARESK